MVFAEQVSLRQELIVGRSAGLSSHLSCPYLGQSLMKCSSSSIMRLTKVGRFASSCSNSLSSVLQKLQAR